jgi:phage gpG-like protein
MNGSGFKVNLSELKALIGRLEDPRIRTMILQIPQKTGSVALVAQAIAENFEKEGPGWEPLKAATILRSVSKAMRRKIQRGKLKPEDARRKILQRTGLLKKSVTTPGAQGNIFQVQGTQMIWGTHLIYAGIHQHGGVIRRGDSQTRIPARPYLRLSEHWNRELEQYVLAQTLDILDRYLVGRAAA